MTIHLTQAQAAALFALGSLGDQLVLRPGRLFGEVVVAYRHAGRPVEIVLRADGEIARLERTDGVKCVVAQPRLRRRR